MKTQLFRNIHPTLIYLLMIVAIPQAMSETSILPAEQDPLIGTLNIKNLTMRQFARLLSQGSGWKIIVSQGASEVNVSTYLENIHTEDALKAVCQAYNLWYKKDPTSGIISIITLDEYKKGMRLHTTEAVEVITLTYPDACSVGDALQRLFSDRVVWHRSESGENDPIDDIDLALERMDALADRAKFSLNSDDDDDDDDDSSDRDERNSRYRLSGNPMSGKSQVVEDIKRDIAAETLLEKLSRSQDQPLTGRIDQPGVVYISSFRGTNDLLLRSNDPESLKEIIKVIKQLDKPKPQVLLEVKVLDLTLDNEFAAGIDWLFQAGDFSGGRSVGLNPTEIGTSYGQILPPSDTMVPQGTGLETRATILQLVTDHVLNRIQLLEERNCITSLATPTLCVADNEASRVFVGTETTVLTAVSVRQYTTTGNNPVTTVSVDPQTNRQNIGTTLLITPRIHADRTATIRIVQEDSELGRTQTIKYGTGNSFQSQDVNTRSVVTTVLAADGKISAIGGLIREEDGKREIGVPWLMDVPYIGPLFKTTFTNRQRHELLVLIRPFILLAPGEAEPVSRSLIQRISRHPSARDDIPASQLGENDPLLHDEKCRKIPSQAFDDPCKRATIWTTE